MPMSIPRSTQFKALQLHNMPVDCHWIIEADKVSVWGDMWIRRAASDIKAKYNINLKCHKNKDGSLTVSHSSEKATQAKSLAFDRLVWLRDQLEQCRRRKLADSNPNAFLQEMFAIQEQIDSTLNELRYEPGEPRKRSGNSIRQPLIVILEFYGITHEIWGLLPPKIQTQKRIQAEVEIKNRRRSLENL